jgi:hypothetical protein
MAREEYESKKIKSLEARKALELFKRNNEENNIRSNHPPRSLPVEHLISTEKINNIESPQTMPTRLAVIDCLMKGISKEQAPMFISVKRRADVQVGAHVLKIINTCLRCPVIDANLERKFEAYYHNRTERAQENVDKKRREQVETNKKKAEKMCPLKITRMPWDLITSDETCAKYDTRKMLLLQEALYYCHKIEKIVSRERHSKFKKELFTLPSFYAIPEELESKRKRISQILDNFVLQPVSLPLWYYDVTYCVTELPGINEWYEMEHEEICIDIWAMFIKMGQPRYAFVRCVDSGHPLVVILSNDKAGIPITKELSPDMYSLFVENKLNLNVRNACYMMDMFRYADQSTTTTSFHPINSATC